MIRICENVPSHGVQYLYLLPDGQEGEDDGNLKLTSLADSSRLKTWSGSA